MTTRIAGRVQEQELLRRAVGGSVEGTPCAVFVHGEAGVGKTRLVTALAEESAQRGHVVLRGRCLRFGATSSPYLPFVSAFQGWLEEGNSADGVALPLYDDGSMLEGPSQVVHVIDRAFGYLVNNGPVVLVLDDLQWADVSSLDALAYLIAGFRHQRLAILATYRDEGIPDGHPLHGWLADMLRMPGVLDVPLERLSLDETGAQLTDLLGAKPQPALVTDVWERSGETPTSPSCSRGTSTRRLTHYPTTCRRRSGRRSWRAGTASRQRPARSPRCSRWPGVRRRRASWSRSWGTSRSTTRCTRPPTRA